MESTVEKNVVPNKPIYQKLFAELKEQLREDEEIILVLGGCKNYISVNKHEMEAILICTNKRMLMLNHRNVFSGVKSQTISVIYDNLNDITITKGMVMDTLTIDTKGEKLNLGMPKNVSKIALTYDLYETIMSQKRNKVNEGVQVLKEEPSLKRQLIDLKELLDLGIITQDEFEAKKKAILS